MFITAIGWPISTILATLLPAVVVNAAFFVSVIVWIRYALLRIHADDRRTLQLLSARLAPR